MRVSSPPLTADASDQDEPYGSIGPGFIDAPPGGPEYRGRGPFKYESGITHDVTKAISTPMPRTRSMGNLSSDRPGPARRSRASTDHERGSFRGSRPRCAVRD